MLTIIRSRAVRVIAAAMFAVGLTGCSSMYVDNTVPEVTTYQKPAQPQPVQLFFEFQTKGVMNQMGTGHLKARVTEQVRSSGLFSEVSEGPVANGASLTVVVNNVPLTDDYFAKGFAAGLTLGLAGTQVGDGYVCASTYRASASSAPIQKKSNTAIYTTVGNTAKPAHADKVGNVDEAITRAMRIAISQLLNETSRDAAFQ